MKTSYTNKLHNNKDLPKKITLNKEEQKKWGWQNYGGGKTHRCI